MRARSCSSRTRGSAASWPRSGGRDPSMAVTVSATDLETGHTVVFVERGVEEPIHTTDAAVEWVPVRLRPQHALASAAIPIVFPTVRVAGRIFTDGGVRQKRRKRFKERRADPAPTPPPAREKRPQDRRELP